MAISITQSWGGRAWDGISPNSPTAQGALLVAVSTRDRGDSSGGISDTAGNTWIQAVANTSDTNWWTCEIWYVDNANSLDTDDTVEANHGADFEENSLIVFEIDTDGLDIVDVRTTGTKNIADENDTTITADAASSVGDIVFAGMGSQILEPTGVSTTGWVFGGVEGENPGSAVAPFIAMAYREVDANETSSATFTVDGSGDAGGAIAVLETSGGEPAISAISPPVGLQVV